jgi:uncharacterized membrane protein YfcA
MDLLLLLVTGAVAGALAGLLGIGGGVIIVPALAFVFLHQGVQEGVIMHVAIGTSLATIMVTSLSSIRAHQRHGAIHWNVFREITPGLLLGALLGAAVAGHLRSDALRVIFAVFLILVAGQLWMGRASQPHRRLPGRAGILVAGSIIGALSALFGVGGGSMTVPFLTWCNMPVRNAIATSAAIGLPIALSGTAGFVYSGWGSPARPEWTIGYVNLPAALGIGVASTLLAPLGAKLAHTIPDAALRRIFAVLLIVVAVKMFAG